jgi:hypothetical protein
VPAGALLMGAIASSAGVPLALLIGALLSLACGIGGWIWLRRIHPSQRRPLAVTVAAADIGAIDPEGRSAGTAISGARPR